MGSAGSRGRRAKVGRTSMPPQPRRLRAPQGNALFPAGQRVLVLMAGRDVRVLTPDGQPDITGAPGRTRTCDARFRKPTLYPLSYGGIFGLRLNSAVLSIFVLQRSPGHSPMRDARPLTGCGRRSAEFMSLQRRSWSWGSQCHRLHGPNDVFVRTPRGSVASETAQVAKPPSTSR
jgi:hypothetical protein